ncbi:MAG: ribbon-helix-helix protein, CopG family [Deltaproteobacteria bacterium]|nr:ribbon-helix-helix protein, CopG family [Deltaproteobacteria bacterium]MBW2285853.1 ribbon-helix-helix protein, CopG family [Deltaproteobacteria bacterium]
MTTAKVAITLERNLLKEVDALVKSRVYPSRSRAIQEAVADKLRRIKGDRLARECARLDRDTEQELAEEGMDWELEECPEY